MMVLRVILKEILSVYFRLISSLIKSHSNFVKLEIKCKIGLRFFLFFTFGTQNIWCIAHSVYCRVQGKRKIDKFIPDRKYIAIHQEHFSSQWEKVLPQISGLRIWCPSRKFGHEINWKSLFYLALLDRLKAEVNSFIREFFEVFYFPSDFIGLAESF